MHGKINCVIIKRRVFRAICYYSNVSPFILISSMKKIAVRFVLQMVHRTNTFSCANKFKDFILNSPALIFVATQSKNIYRIIINYTSPKTLFF